jgi:iron complex transport system substrate-binding protein
MLKSLVPVLAILASTAAAQGAATRVVSLGGDVTETVFALGEGKRLVCADQTSVFPAAAAKLPQVGYLRTLSAEGVMSCRPDLILASEAAGPAAALKQLAASGVRIARITGAETPDAARKKIASVADALGIADHGRAMLEHFDAAMTATEAALKAYTDRPRAIFLMAHGPGGALAAGQGTAAHAMLALAHAENAAAGLSGYKPLTPEASLALHPDVIVIDAMSLKSLGGIEAFKARPEIQNTPAAKTGRIVAVDTMFTLGFGPRTPEAITALAKAIHSKTP